VNASLQHSSQQTEAGIDRLTEFEIPAVAAGELSKRFSQAALGGLYEFTGFLARRTAIAEPWCFTSLIFVLHSQRNI
jgi:primosomal replication protein N